MTIEVAILGFLSYAPLSGYDLKKLLSQSESLHWSGNNNQIYRALVDLHEKGLVERDEEAPSAGPARKVYSLTEAGDAALRDSLLSAPELPEMRTPMLARLVGADTLSNEDLDRILTAYGDELRGKIWALEEMERRGDGIPDLGSERQRVIWQAMHQRAIAFYRAEMEWAATLRWSVGKIVGGAD